MTYVIHHLTNFGYISWYEFALKIIELSNLKTEVNPILSSEYKTLAKRGLNSRLSKSKNISMQNWIFSLRNFIDEESN
jgi:dTDP-4-dehydrorhamnose reductase